MKKILTLLFSWALFSCAKKHLPETIPPSKSHSAFTIPVFPDTQRMLGLKRKMFISKVHWVARAKDSLNIPVALHVGDLVNYNTHRQFRIAGKIKSVLEEAKLPFIIVPGNHDTEVVSKFMEWKVLFNQSRRLRKTAKFNKYFPPERFVLQKGAFEADKSDNSFHLFEAGGKNWLVVTLEFLARPDAASWADSVIAAHPNHNAIVLTHYHLNSDGEIASTNRGYGDMQPDHIFHHHLKKHSNLLLILSGHKCYTASRKDAGSNGNTIYSILQNYQCRNGGDGYLRLLEIDTKASTITGRMYSPYYDKWDDEATIGFNEVKFID